MKINLTLLYLSSVLFIVIFGVLFNAIGSILTIDFIYVYSIVFVIYFLLLLFWIFLSIKIYKSQLDILMIVIGSVIAVTNLIFKNSYESYSDVIWTYTDGIINKDSENLKILTQKNIYNLHNLIIRVPLSYNDNSELDEEIFREKLDAYAGCKIRTEKIRAKYYAVQFSC